MVGPVLLCIDPHHEPILVRRYKRNVYGKVWVTGEALLEGGITENTAWELNNFRNSTMPARLPTDHLPEGST